MREINGITDSIYIVISSFDGKLRHGKILRNMPFFRGFKEG